jgi:flagellar basal-body rod modification protein FlgD
MPSMGRPSAPGSNPFAGIAKAETTTTSGRQRDLGEQLNRLAGRPVESRFVDASKHNQLDKDSFLKLLSHQLQNQDPMEPVDQKKFAADLAQFSQLEQLANLNSKMENMGNNQPAEIKFHGASFLGKEVLTSGTSLDYAGDRSWVTLPFSLDENAKEVSVRLFDSQNQMIAEIKKENLSKGNHQLTWDGEMNDGSPALKDKYRMEVIGTNTEGQMFRAQTQSSGKVTGVTFESGETILGLEDGRKVFLRDVSSFRLPQENNAMAQKMPGLQEAAAKAYNQQRDEL